MSGALLVGALASQPGSGCVLPPDLNPAGADAGPSSPPIILAATPVEYAFPGPITINREDSLPIGLDVRDNDAGDSLYVRLYRDYLRGQEPVETPALADCQAGPNQNGDLDRHITCSTNALCNLLDPDDNADHVLEAMIADRRFIPDGDPEAALQPPYRALEDRDHAAWSFGTWIMRCRPGQ